MQIDPKAEQFEQVVAGADQRPFAVHLLQSPQQELPESPACRDIGVSDHTFYRWRQQYGGLRIDQARRLREMEAENGRLRRAVSDLTLDNQILKEAARGNF